ncbi:hypothetical protein BH09GEM1_BH09GEM1_12100 [soil metagenome]
MMRHAHAPSAAVMQVTAAAFLGTLPTLTLAQSPAMTDTTSRQAHSSAFPEFAASTRRVAARPIKRGAVLVSADIAYAQFVSPVSHPLPHSVAALDSVQMPLMPAAETDSLIGWTSRRVILKGETLHAPAVVAPDLVKAGQQVEVLWDRGGVRVTAKGTAMRGGRENDHIVVRLAERRTVEAAVVGAGRVRVATR